MEYFPIFCRLSGRKCLIVGGGEIAERKARLLLEAGAELHVAAPVFTPQFQQWEKQGRLVLHPANFQESLLESCWLVIAATDKEEVNQQVSIAAERAHIFCNMVDSPKAAGFIMPAIIDRSPLIVAVSTGGAAPVLCRLLREKFESLLPSSLGRLAACAQGLRPRVKARFSTLGERRRFWEKFFVNTSLADALERQEGEKAAAITERLLKEDVAFQGEVTLVGAGPGSPDLLTLRALQKIQQAEVVIYDRLISKGIMDLVRRDAERIFVGKEAGHHCVPQDQINQLLVHHAKQGKSVVRLKGGDPFIFGRGGEELEALCGQGVDFSVVPGVTAACGCASYAGIPLTHREYAQSVHFITGHLQKGSGLSWEKFVSEKQTLVFYMGAAQAANIAQNLIKAGMREDMPACVIEKGTTAGQRVLTGKISELEKMAAQSHSPALIIVGEVVSLREKLNWF